MTRLILDVDTGIDDALALAYLATFDTVDVLGVIGTYGNVSVDTAVRNTSYVLERLGLRHIPVIRGSSHPSWARCFIPDAGCAQFHGTDGLGGFGPACDSSSSDTAFSDIFSDNSGSDTVFSRDYRSLISVGGYDVHDPHANPAADSFSLSFTACDAGGEPVPAMARGRAGRDDLVLPRGIADAAARGAGVGGRVLVHALVIATSVPISRY